MSTIDIIDVSTFDKQKENELRKEKIKKKLDEKDMSNEVDRKYKKTHVQNPLIHSKTPQKNEELEKSKVNHENQKIVHCAVKTDLLLNDHVEKEKGDKLKTESLFEKYKREKALAELAKHKYEEASGKALVVPEDSSLDVAIDNFSTTVTSQVANENLTNLISSFYSDNIIKKQIFKQRLTSNPVVQRNNQRLIYNTLTSLPLSLQFPLFIGLEILQTEDAYNQLVFSEQVKQQQQKQNSKVEEVKE